MALINMIRKDREILSPEEYLKLKQTNSASIKQTRIVPCTLGSDGFGGGIEVTYRYPLYVMDGTE